MSTRSAFPFFSCAGPTGITEPQKWTIPICELPLAPTQWDEAEPTLHVRNGIQTIGPENGESGEFLNAPKGEKQCD